MSASRPRGDGTSRGSRTLRQATGFCLSVAAVSIIAVTALQGGGSPALAQYGGTPTRVNAFGCLARPTAHVTRPAGSTIVISQGFATTAPGAVRGFVTSQTTAVSVNDDAMIDVSDRWSAPESLVGGGSTRLLHDTTVTLEHPGDSMRFTFALILNRPFTDPSDYDDPPDGKLDPARLPKGLSFGGTCTVTAT